MDSTQNKTTFDELVSGISAEERNFLLAKKGTKMTEKEMSNRRESA